MAFTQVKNIWLGYCALGSFMAVWQRPGAPFTCIQPIPLSCGLRKQGLISRQYTYSKTSSVCKMFVCSKRFGLQVMRPCNDSNFLHRKKGNLIHWFLTQIALFFWNSSQISLPYILRVLYNQLRHIKAMISPTVLMASFAFANIDQKRPSIDVNVPAVACPAPVSSRLLSFSQLLPLLPFVFFLPLLLLFSFLVPRVSAPIAHSATNRGKKNHENG